MEFFSDDILCIKFRNDNLYGPDNRYSCILILQLLLITNELKKEGFHSCLNAPKMRSCSLIPVLKSVVFFNVNNYRSISIHPYLSKINKLITFTNMKYWASSNKIPNILLLIAASEPFIFPKFDPF